MLSYLQELWQFSAFCGRFAHASFTARCPAGIHSTTHHEDGLIAVGCLENRCSARLLLKFMLKPRFATPVAIQCAFTDENSNRGK